MLPWALIKLYYAAFYAGQAILRICGQSCSYFYSEHASVINELRKASGKAPTFIVKRGLYHCVANAALTDLKCVQVGGATIGGHDSFWKMFGGWIDRAQKVLVSLPATAEIQEVVIVLSQLDDLLCDQGKDYDWLSHVRNNLQYRQDFGVWLPSKMRNTQRGDLSRLASQWTREPLKIDLEIGRPWPLGKFVVGCAFVVALCRDMLTKLAERLGGRSFVHFGALPS